MLDIAVAYNRYKFLGFEFLTWLWFAVENDKDALPKSGVFAVGNRIVLENREHKNVENITIKGDDAGLEEGMMALKKGALVTEMNIIYREDQGNKWQFLVKGENINVQQIKHPDVGTMETSEDLDTFVFEKSYHYNKVMEIIDSLFAAFIKCRLSSSWSEEVQRIKNWIGAV